MTPEEAQAHNRQLVAALERVTSTFWKRESKAGAHTETHFSEATSRDLPCSVASEALQLPSAKVAQAEAAVIEAAEKTIKTLGNAYINEELAEETFDLYMAVEALKAARAEADVAEVFDNAPDALGEFD